MSDGPIGLRRGALSLRPYDDAWVSCFQAERATLMDNSGGLITVVEHVGSTSIPGLDAKPVIDLQAALPNLHTARRLIPRLVELGYTFMPERVYDNRIFLPKGSEECRTHYLSLIEADTDEWRVRLRFRDALRESPALRQEYQDLKRGLAARNAGDRTAYTAAKTDFVRRVLAGYP
jgi:GrpB-like predicted nucleotidyltransferase (UPF0157 family)